MAKELQFYGNPDTQSGFSLQIDIFDSSGQEVFSNISVPEISNTAIYITDMPTLPADNYVVRFFTSQNFIAQGNIDWDGEKEICRLKDIWQNEGLDPNNPLVVTPNSRVAGDVELEINSDCETFTEVTRQ